MLPAIVLPLHDTEGSTIPHLEAITPQLKQIFARTFISISPPTQHTQIGYINRLQKDPFFKVNFNRPDTLVGDHFISAYQSAVDNCPSVQVLHLCFIDRVAFALQSEYKDQFVGDVRMIDSEQVPVLFQRSQTAWSTHSQNYRDVEHIATKVGELLFNQSLDFTWCHLALQTQQLKVILPHVKNHDLGILAEMVLLLKDKMKTKDVDWLAWEDPFICARNPDQLRQERENSLQETHKRLAYLIPVLQVLARSIGPSRNLCKTG